MQLNHKICEGNFKLYKYKSSIIVLIFPNNIWNNLFKLEFMNNICTVEKKNL